MSSARFQPRKNGASLDRLNPQQRMFVMSLLADEGFNGTKAAQRAGYKNPRQAANKLMNHPVVQAAVGKAIADRARRLELEADDVLLHLKHALYLDPLDIFRRTDDGGFEMKPLEEIPEATRRCINSMKSRTRYDKDGARTVEAEITLMNKDSMMGLVMKHLNLLDPPEDVREQRNTDEDIFHQLMEVVERRSNIIDAQVIEQKVIESK